MKLKEILSSHERIRLLNESNKPLKYSICVPEVKKALEDFVEVMPEDEWVIIGGIAMGCYTRSRATTDIDIAVLSADKITQTRYLTDKTFNKNRKGALTHKDTGVEIEFLYPGFIGQSSDLIEKAIENARVEQIDGKNVRVATPKYIIALKLGRAIKNTGKALIDQGDIKNLIEIYGKIDLSDLDLPKDQIDLYEKLCA